MIIIAREFAVTGLRSIAAAEGIVIAASSWGKAKTVTQIIAIILALVNLNYNNVSFGIINKFIVYPHRFLNITTDIAMGLAIIITIISGVDYFIKNKDVISYDK